MSFNGSGGGRGRENPNLTPAQRRSGQEALWRAGGSNFTPRGGWIDPTTGVASPTVAGPAGSTVPAAAPGTGAAGSGTSTASFAGGATSTGTGVGVGTELARKAKLAKSSIIGGA